jgi:hypothetical protein
MMAAEENWFLKHCDWYSYFWNKTNRKLSVSFL